MNEIIQVILISCIGAMGMILIVYSPIFILDLIERHSKKSKVSQ